MKRIALLLAAVGLGSGCVVETTDTCDAGTLTLEWGFTAVNGAAGLACNSTSLSADIETVDIYLDGSSTPAASYVDCYDYGISFLDVAAGSHDVMVEGYDAFNNVIARDWFTVSVAGCEDEYVVAQPGEGIIEFLPTVCELGTTYLAYELWDRTGTPYVISAIYPDSALLTTFTCTEGIGFPVPYGSYSLAAIEETNSTGSTVYASKCTPTYVDVLTYGTTSTDVTLNTTDGACFF